MLVCTLASQNITDLLEAISKHCPKLEILTIESNRCV
jgi:hypothetical protein